MLGPMKYAKSNATGRYCLRLEGAVDRFLPQVCVAGYFLLSARKVACLLCGLR